MNSSRRSRVGILFGCCAVLMTLCAQNAQSAAQMIAGDAIPPSMLHPVSPPGSFDTPPKLRHGFAPWYPLRQAQSRKPGQVTVEFNVGVDGKTNDIKIVSSTGYGFWKYSQWAVEKWKFEPAQKNGHPVSVRLRVVFHFNA